MGVLAGGGAQRDAPAPQGQSPALRVEDADVAVGLHLGGGAVVGVDVVDVEGGRQGGVVGAAQVPLQAEDHVPGHAPQGGVGGGQAPGQVAVPVEEYLPLPALDAVEVVVRGDVLGAGVGVPAEGPVVGLGIARPDVRGGGHGVEVEGLLDVDLRVRVGCQRVLAVEVGGLEPDSREHVGGRGQCPGADLHVAAHAGGVEDRLHGTEGVVPALVVLGPGPQVQDAVGGLGVLVTEGPDAGGRVPQPLVPA